MGARAGGVCRKPRDSQPALPPGDTGPWEERTEDGPRLGNTELRGLPTTRTLAHSGAGRGGGRKGALVAPGLCAVRGAAPETGGPQALGTRRAAAVGMRPVHTAVCATCVQLTPFPYTPWAVFKERPQRVSTALCALGILEEGEMMEKLLRAASLCALVFSKSTSRAPAFPCYARESP